MASYSSPPEKMEVQRSQDKLVVTIEGPNAGNRELRMIAGSIIIGPTPALLIPTFANSGRGRSTKGKLNQAGAGSRAESGIVIKDDEEDKTPIPDFFEKFRGKESWDNDVVLRSIGPYGAKRTLFNKPVKRALNFKPEFNLEFHTSKLNSCLVQSRGTVNRSPCIPCRKITGPFADSVCVSFREGKDTLHGGACAGCIWGGGTRGCDHHEDFNVDEDATESDEEIASK